MTRPVRITLTVFAGFFGLILACAVALTWRLSSGPIEATQLTPYIEGGINHYLPGMHAQIAHTLTRWDNMEHVIALQADDITITADDGSVIATIPYLDVSLSGFWLLTGHIVPVGLHIDHPHFELLRDSDGVLRFRGSSGQESAGNTKPHKNKDIKGTVKTILDDMTHATHTRDLRVENILFDVHDDKTGSDWAVHVPEISLQHTWSDLNGHAQVLVTQKDNVSTVEVAYHYDPQKDWHLLDTHVSSLTPSFFAGEHSRAMGLGALAVFDLPLSGDMTVAFDGDLNLKTASVEFHGDEGQLIVPEMWDQPRAVKALDFKGAFDQENSDHNLATLGLDFGGPTLNVKLTGQPSAVPEHDATFEMAVQLDNWPMDRFKDLWPKDIITNPREWIAKSLSKGTFDHGEVVLKGALSFNDPGNPTLTEGGGKIIASNARVDYLDGMPPVEGVSAKATFDLDQMTVDISGGGIGSLRLRPFTILLTDFEKDVQNIDIPLKFTGPIPSVLKLIGVPRLGYTQDLGLQPDDVTGSATGVVQLRFPLLNDIKMDDVDIKAHADLNDVASGKLVKKIDITQGNLALDLTKDDFTVKGSASLNKIFTQIAWLENFKKEEGKPLRKGTISGIVGDEQWKQFDIDALRGTHGPVAVTLDIVQMKKDVTVITIKNDMTNADIHVVPLKWEKPVGQKAELDVVTEISEGKNIVLKSINLTALDAAVKGTATLTPKADGLVSLDLNPLRMGRTDLALKYKKDGNDLHFDAEGASFDISGFKDLKKTKDSQGAESIPAFTAYTREFYVHLAKIYSSEGGFITDMQGYAIRDPEGWKEINLKGNADGDTPLNIDLGEKDGLHFFAMDCDNFGKALKGLGVTNTVSDGKVQIHGQSTPENPRVIDGTINISHFNVKGLPALVVLLNATSPFGFKNLLNGSMDFDHVKGKFRWQGDTIDFQDVHAAGTAVGLDIEGKVDMSEGNADLHGIVAPFSTINNILGAIPWLGDVLTGATGEKGGVFALAYTIKGNLNQPKVSVNPASLLTPGFLRNIFFGGVDKPDVEPATPMNAAAVGSEPPQPPPMPTPNNLGR